MSPFGRRSTVPDLARTAVEDLDWDAVRRAADAAAVRARATDTLDRVEAVLDREGGPGFLFDKFRERPDDRAIHVTEDPGRQSVSQFVSCCLHQNLP